MLSSNSGAVSSETLSKRTAYSMTAGSLVSPLEIQRSPSGENVSLSLRTVNHGPAEKWTPSSQ